MWDGDVVAEEAPLRFDGTVDRGAATQWHFGVGEFRPLAKQTLTSLLHIVTDHLGTPREMFEDSGELCWSVLLTTWGSTRGIYMPPTYAHDDKRAIYARHVIGGNDAEKSFLDEDSYDCPFRFQGQYADVDTGLSYNRYRYYDQSVCSFVSLDPSKLRGGERLAGYVINTLKYIDPLGLTTTLYRAVSADEAADIANTGRFNPSPSGVESKYFADSEAGAKKYSELSKALTGPRQDIIVKGKIESKLITPGMREEVDRGIRAVAIPNDMLHLVTPEIK